MSNVTRRGSVHGGQTPPLQTHSAENTRPNTPTLGGQSQSSPLQSRGSRSEGSRPHQDPTALGRLQQKRLAAETLAEGDRAKASSSAEAAHHAAETDAIGTEMTILSARAAASMEAALALQATRDKQAVDLDAIVNQRNKLDLGAAHLMETIAVAGNTLTTFGFFMNLGKEVGTTQMETGMDDAHWTGMYEKELLTELHEAEAQANAFAASGVASATGGLGSIGGQTVVAPALMGVTGEFLQRVAGAHGQMLVPIKPELLVRDPSPFVDENAAPEDRAMKSKTDYDAEWVAVRAQRSAIKEQQGKFGINSWQSIAVGAGAFGASIGAKAALTTPGVFPSPGIMTAAGIGIAASGLPGGLVGLSQSLRKMKATTSVAENGHTQQLHLFHVPANPTSFTAQFRAAFDKFTGGRDWGKIPLHTLIQFTLRAAGIYAALAPATALGPAGLDVAIQKDPADGSAQAGANFLTQFVAFTLAVAIWFNVLPMIQSLQDVKPTPPPPGDEENQRT